MSFASPRAGSVTLTGWWRRYCSGLGLGICRWTATGQRATWCGRIRWRQQELWAAGPGTGGPSSGIGLKVQLEPALGHDYPRVLGIAHNAGNNLGTLSTALHYGADVMEIDVISARGQLVAGRNHWWGWLARQVFRGPTLVQGLGRRGGRRNHQAGPEADGPRVPG